MKADKETSSFLILSALTFLLAGCGFIQQPFEVVLEPDSVRHNSVSMSKRFQEDAGKGETVIESAIKLAEEHAKLSEEMAVLRQKNQEFISDNHRLKDRIAALEPELKQAEKELSQANDFLIEMRIELNNWKTDILGFRDEMRDADKAQLQALLEILKVLGGEIKPADSEGEQNE